MAIKPARIKSQVIVFCSPRLPARSNSPAMLSAASGRASAAAACRHRLQPLGLVEQVEQRRLESGRQAPCPGSPPPRPGPPDRRRLRPGAARHRDRAPGWRASLRRRKLAQRRCAGSSHDQIRGDERMNHIVHISIRMVAYIASRRLAPSGTAGSARPPPPATSSQSVLARRVNHLAARAASSGSAAISARLMLPRPRLPPKTSSTGRSADKPSAAHAVVLLRCKQVRPHGIARHDGLLAPK